MRFLVVTFAPLLTKSGQIFSYAPYVREMEMWFRHASEVGFCCPTDYTGKDLLVTPFSSTNYKIFPIPELSIKDTLNPGKIIRTILVLSTSMKWADHIHLRCPGNVGLLGCIVQIFFPHKVKTAKYAGNWDWSSSQPWSYRFQQRILRNTFLTRNMTVLVYGEWPDKTMNIKPFFTASYSEKDRLPVSKRLLSKGISLAFVGLLTENKSPQISLEVLRALSERGVNATLTFCGEGPERINLEKRIEEYGLQDKVVLLGNVSAEKVREVLIAAHFLIFISRSEGWPKAVSEAMWWGCVPITTSVSCVPQMLGHGERGYLVKGTPKEIVRILEDLLKDKELYKKISENGMKWAREYTVERFEQEIKTLVLKPLNSPDQK